MLESLLIVAQQVGVLFMLMAIGFACNKAKLLTEVSVKGMVNVLILIVTPCLIVHSFQAHAFKPDLLVGLGWAFAFSFLSPLLGMLAAALTMRRADRQSVNIWSPSTAASAGATPSSSSAIRRYLRRGLPQSAYAGRPSEALKR